MPEISVIVPIYNAEKHLCRCIDSILRQSFHDIEIILVDDGSTDSSPEMCDQYKTVDERIKVIHKRNGGVSSARNIGMRDASGKYIMFCDSDDYVSATWCQVLHEVILQNSDAFVCCDVLRKEDTQVFSNDDFDEGAYSVKSVSYFDIYKKGISAYVFNKIYSTEVILRNKLVFDEKCSFGEDAIFNTEYCKLCSSCVYINQKLYGYVQLAESLVHRYYPNRFAMHLPIFEARLPLLAKDDLEEYCDIWLYQFLQLFKNVYDERNSMTALERMQYNHRMMNTDVFKYCVAHASGKNESRLCMRVLSMNNYYVYWILEKITSIKQKLWRK